MGSATQLNAEKTGTLTQNRMTVTSTWLGGKVYEDSSRRELRFSDMLYNPWP